MKFLIAILMGIGATVFCAGLEVSEEEFDPSIWSIKTRFDYIFSDDALNSVNTRVFSEDDYELKDLLVACANFDDWTLFESMLQVDVEEWESIPDIEAVVDAIVMGESDIIYGMFLEDVRIRKDPRIKELVTLFFRKDVKLSRMAFAFDSKVFKGALKRWDVANEIFRRVEMLPVEWYLDVLPTDEMFTGEPDRAGQFMINMISNVEIPEEVMRFIVQKTKAPLHPIQIAPHGMRMSLHALADVYDNAVFWRVLMDSQRYVCELGKFNTKVDLLCKRMIQQEWQNT